MDILHPGNSQDFLQWTNFLPTTETVHNTAEVNKKPSFFKSHKPRLRERFVICWATKLDEICRLTFPLTFLLLSIAYWLIFLFRWTGAALQWKIESNAAALPKCATLYWAHFQSKRARNEHKIKYLEKHSLIISKLKRRYFPDYLCSMFQVLWN